MPNQIITTRSPPRRNLAVDPPLSSPNSVRVYRASPEDVMLQLRRSKDYCSVALSFDEARKVAALLLAAVGEG